MASSRETVGFPARNSSRVCPRSSESNKKLERHARAPKHGRPTENLGIFDDGAFHNPSCPPERLYHRLHQAIREDPIRDRRCTYKVHVHQTPDSVLCPPVRANSAQERQARHWIAQICSGEGLQVGLLAATEKPTASTSTNSAFFAQVDSCDSLKIPRCSFPQLPSGPSVCSLFFD